MTRPLLIEGMRGLGDNIYQRPFVRAAAARRQVYLETPWPELYADLPVRFVKTETTLRTQALNEARQAASTWRPPPRFVDRVKPGYGSHALRTASIVKSLEATLPLARTPFAFDLPDMGAAPKLANAGRPIAVIRPATVRREWRNEARNPRPDYLRDVARWLLATHYVVVVAHLAGGEEWLDGELPAHHQAFTAGELGVRQLLALVRDADLVVGGVGWLVPAAIALKVPAFVVLGGQGGHNAPEKITDPRMDLSRIGWATPRPYCRCENMRHRCLKLIPDLPAQWAAFRDRVSLAA